MITTEKITTTDVKRFNKNRIFRLIHYKDKISRQEIADILQLSLPTVNQNLKMLFEQNLIEFVGNFESTGGRKAQAITVNGMSKCAISVNIYDSGIKVALVNLKGDIIFSEKKTAVFSSEDEYGKIIAELVEDVIQRNSVAKEDVLGVGITIPGIFDNENRVIMSAPTMGIKNYPISALTAHIPYECRAMNDARANSYAEFWFARQHEKREMVSIEDFNNSSAAGQDIGKMYLMLNTGVGGSYINNEKIELGKHNRYGEFGHMTIHPDGKKCLCGRNGCLEAYVSAKRLSDDLGITLDEFFAQLNAGNEEYMGIFNQYVEDLTTGINNMYIMCDGDITIGGPVSHYLEKFDGRIRKKLIEKYPFDTDASYLAFARCTTEQSDTGAALTFLGEFIRNI